MHTWTLVEIPLPFPQEALEVCVNQDVEFVHVLLNQLDRDLIRILYDWRPNTNKSFFFSKSVAFLPCKSYKRVAAQ
jgi:hypothetical protein